MKRDQAHVDTSPEGQQKPNDGDDGQKGDKG